MFMVLIALAILEPLLTYKQMSSYAQDIDTGATFFFKSNPSITCTITGVSRTGYKKPNVELTVTYPDGSQGELLTPLTEFNHLWEKLN